AAATLPEGQPGADDEILDGAGRQHFARRRFGCDAGADVHGDAADVVSHALALARVQSGAHLETERTHGIADGQATAHPPGRAVEQREEAIAGRRDVTASEMGELPPDECMVTRKQVGPCPVTKASSLLRR